MGWCLLLPVELRLGLLIPILLLVALLVFEEAPRLPLLQVQGGWPPIAGAAELGSN
jgi:hypothetical protein